MTRPAPNTTETGALACAFRTPWRDHFQPPVGTGLGCPACETSMNETYRDGVGIERCNRCGYAIRGKDDAPLATLPLTDVEVLALMLDDALADAITHGSTADVRAAQTLLGRLQEACGRTVAQLRGAPA